MTNACDDTQSDRFISARPDVLFPMNTTPRTTRIAQVFGLTDDRILKFIDSPSAIPDGKVLTSLRRSASQLFYTTPTVPPTSASANLAKRKQFILALDGPGIPQDPWAYPLAWSRKNVIAVACGHDVYYQNLDTRQIAHLCNLPRPSMGRIRAIAFATDKPELVCMGTTTGNVQVWDSETRMRLRTWPNQDWMGVSAMSWKGAEFVTGRNDGKISICDIRTQGEVLKFKGHRGDVYAVQWSHDERYLASSDNRGAVHLWDARNMTNHNSRRLGKVKHDGPVKVRGTRSSSSCSY